MPNPTSTPTYLPTFFTYWPTSISTEMEKGKSKQPLVQKDDKDKDDKKKDDKDKDKDKNGDKLEVPARQPLTSGRPPFGSISRPGTSISRPAHVSNVETTVPSAAPSEDLPESAIGSSSEGPSQLPSSSLNDALLSIQPSQAPSLDETTILSVSPSLYPSDTPSADSSSRPSHEPSQMPSLEPTILKESQNKDGQNQQNITNKDSSTKVSISGDILNKQETNVSIGKNGKVSFTASDEDDTIDATTKLSMSGVLSNKKYDDVDISISKRGKVSFSGVKEDTPEPSPAPNEKEISTKISMNGILSSEGKSGAHASKVSFARSGDVDITDTSSAPSYMPTYFPTAATGDHDKQPSSSNSGKVALSFPTSTNKKHKEAAPSTVSSNFKPISYYTETPTSDATSLLTSPSPQQTHNKEKNEKTPSHGTTTGSEEPTHFVYPTYYPTTVTESKEITSIPTYYPTLAKQESRSYDSESIYPTYWPSYMPTSESKHRPSFGFGDATGRESNFGLINFHTPEYDDDSIDKALYGDNAASSENETTIFDFMAIKPPTVISDESPDIYRKKICPGYPLGNDPSAPKVEYKVFFTYGIEINKSENSNIADAVEDMQRSILDDTASAILRCDGRRVLSGDEKKPVSRVYYKRDTAISTLSKCTSTAEASQCAIVESAIYLSVIKGQEDEARVETLSVINHRLETSYYETGSIEYTHYLGPNVEQLTMNMQRSIDDAPMSLKTTHTSHYLFYGAIAAVSLAVCAFAILAVVVVRNKMKKRRASIHHERFAKSDSLSRSYETHHDNFCPHNRTHRSSELTNWRSLVGRERTIH